MCKGGSSSGSGTSTVTSTSKLDPTVEAAYKSLISQAQGIAGPNAQYQQYTGQMVAPLTSDQTSAIGQINAAQGLAQPYYNTAAGLAAQGTTALSPQQFSASAVNQYMDPYVQQVVNATQANINASNQTQQSQLLGQAIQSGASPFGSDRAGIAAADLARQQDLASQQTISGLYSQGYQQAEGEFNTQQQTALAAQQQNNANALQGAQLYAGLGSTAEGTALQGASAQLQAGTLEQQQTQNTDTNAYNQFLQQTYYPFQTTSYLSNIVEGLGNQFPTSSTQSSTPAQPSVAGQVAGGALAGLGILGSTGAFGSGGWLQRGGAVHARQGGGIAGGPRMGGLAGLPGVHHFRIGGSPDGGDDGNGGMGNQGGGSGPSNGGGNSGTGLRGPTDASGQYAGHTNANGPAGVATGQSNPAGHSGGVGSNYQGAVSDYANRDLADKIGSHLSPAEEMQPNINYPSTYANGLAHWGINPAAAVGTIASLATGVPLIGAALGAGYTALGFPDIPVGSASPAPLAGTNGTPDQTYDGTGGPSAPAAPQAPHQGGTGNAVVPNALPGQPGAVVGPTAPIAPPATPPAPTAPTVAQPYQNAPTVIPKIGPGLVMGQTPGGVPYPTYTPQQFLPESMGGAVLPSTAGHFAAGGMADGGSAADADPTPFWDTSGGTASVTYPSNGETIDTGLPVPSGSTSDKIGSFFDNPWLGLAEAGLGIMASGSPYPGVAIGQGGLTGIQAYEQGRQSAANTGLTQQQAKEAGNQAALSGMEVKGYQQLQNLMTPSAAPASAPAAPVQQSAAQTAPQAVAQAGQGIAAGTPQTAPAPQTAAGIAAGMAGGLPSQGSIQPLPNASMDPSQQPQIQPIPNASMDPNAQLQVQPVANTQGLPATAPNVTGKALPMPQVTPGIQQGAPNPQPMFNLPQLAAQARVMMTIPGMSGQASSLLGMITKAVPEGMYLGQDGALYNINGVTNAKAAQALAGKGMVQNSAGGWTFAPGVVQAEAGEAGAKSAATQAGIYQYAGPIAGAKASAEFPYKVAENAAFPRTMTPGASIVSGGKVVAQSAMPIRGIDANGRPTLSYVYPQVTSGGPSPTFAAQPQGIAAGAPQGAAPAQPPQAQAGPPQSPLVAGLAAPQNITPGAPQAPGSVMPGGPIVTGLSPIEKESQESQGAELEKYSAGLNDAAKSAVGNNFLIDQMRSESQTWRPGWGAGQINNAKAAIQGLAQMANVATPNLDAQVADAQAFRKNAVELTRQVVKQTSSRAALQEFTILQNAQPNEDMSKGGLNQIMNQYQSINDYTIAKQQAAQAWRQTHDGTLQGFDPAFNQSVTPSVFWAIRTLAESPDEYKAVASRLSQTDAGRGLLSSINKQYITLQQAGMLPDLTAQAGLPQ